MSLQCILEYFGRQTTGPGFLWFHNKPLSEACLCVLSYAWNGRAMEALPDFVPGPHLFGGVVFPLPPPPPRCPHFWGARFFVFLERHRSQTLRVAGAGGAAAVLVPRLLRSGAGRGSREFGARGEEARPVDAGGGRVAGRCSRCGCPSKGVGLKGHRKKQRSLFGAVPLLWHMLIPMHLRKNNRLQGTKARKFPGLLLPAASRNRPYFTVWCF